MFKTKSVIFGCALGLALTSASNAFADPRTHDGFYLQLDTGLGYLNSSAEDDFGNESSLSGATLASQLLIGGSPMPGFVIGGEFMMDYAFAPGLSVNGSDLPADISAFLISFGPFVDFYPDPEGGLHFQGYAGWGGLEVSQEGNVGGSDPTGLVLALGAGYDFWVGEEWSIGGLARFTYAPLSLNDVTYSTIAPALLASFTYH